MLINRTVIIALGIVLLLIVATIFSNGKPTQSYPSSESSLINSTISIAPDFSLLNTENKYVKLSQFKGKVILLNFWATWCGPCRMEIPGLIKLQEKYPEDLVIIGISLDKEGANVVLPFIEKLGINYLILYGDSKVMQDYGGIQGIPTTFLIDRNLMIRKKYVGYRSENQFENDLKEYI